MGGVEAAAPGGTPRDSPLSAVLNGLADEPEWPEWSTTPWGDDGHDLLATRHGGYVVELDAFQNDATSLHVWKEVGERWERLHWMLLEQSAANLKEEIPRILLELFL